MTIITKILLHFFYRRIQSGKDHILHLAHWITNRPKQLSAMMWLTNRLKPSLVITLEAEVCMYVYVIGLSKHIIIYYYSVHVLSIIRWQKFPNNWIQFCKHMVGFLPAVKFILVVCCLSDDMVHVDLNAGVGYVYFENPFPFTIASAQPTALNFDRFISMIS